MSITRKHRVDRPVFAVAAFMLLFVLALAAGCSDDDNPFNTVNEDELAPPLGLRSITGNEEVTLNWFTSNFEGDFEGYIVFMREGEFATDQSTELSPAFDAIDTLELSTSRDPRNITIGGLTNVQTYSFAVVAWGGGDKISRTSNIVEDTPRPEINSITLTSASTADVSGNDDAAAFDFNDSVDPDGFDVEGVPPDNEVDYTTTNGVDIVHEAFDPGPGDDNIRSWMAGMNGGGVQDLGYMGALDDADVAPALGYSGTGESVILTVGHVYAVRTGDNRFGKFIVTDIQGSPDFEVTFNAAVQLAEGNRNYKQGEDWHRALGLSKSPR